MRRIGWWPPVVLLALAACERGLGEDMERVMEPRAEEGLPPGELPPGVDAEQGAAGRRLYALACVMCHGERAEGTQLGPPLATGEWTHGGSLEEIAAVVTEGAAATEEFGVPMPARGDGTFTEEQVRAVSAYVFSLSRGRTAPPPDTADAGT
jgi:mono/diheme cytochrome c family protein